MDNWLKYFIGYEHISMSLGVFKGQGPKYKNNHSNCFSIASHNSYGISIIT